MNEIRTIPHALIDPSPLNPRKSVDDTALVELAASIKAEGLLQNLVVRPGQNGSTGRFEIAAGERRYRAIAQLIEVGDLPADHPIPAVVRELTDLQLLTLATTENMARADMHPLDEARAFAQMLELGSDVETIALETGLSVGTIRKRLALAERLAEPVQVALLAGEINLGQAQALAAAPAKRQKQLVAEIVDSTKRGFGGYSSVDLHRRIRNESIPVSRAVFPLDRYTGSFTQASPFDTQGEDTFDDTAQFHELQATHVEHLRKEYAKRWGWVEVREYHSPYAYDTPGKRDKPADLGVVIVHRHHTGEVEIHEDLKKRPEPERYGDKPTEKDPLALTQKHEDELNAHRSRAIQAAIAKDAHAGLAVLALVLIRPYVSAVGIESRSGLLADQLHPHLKRELEAFAKKLGAPEIVRRGDVVSFDGGRRNGAPTLLDRLKALEPEDLVRLVALLTARQVHVGIAGTWVDTDTNRSAAAAIAAGVNASPHLPTYRQLGVEYLLMYSKPKLEAVAEELCGSHARQWAGLSRKVIAANVFAHVGAELDQVPAELRMGGT